MSYLLGRLEKDKKNGRVACVRVAGWASGQMGTHEGACVWVDADGDSGVDGWLEDGLVGGQVDG